MQQFSFLLTSLLVLLVGICLIAAFIHGRIFFDTVVAFLSHAFMVFSRFVQSIVHACFHSFLLIRWIAISAGLFVFALTFYLGYLYWYKPGTFRLLQYRIPVCSELIDKEGMVLDYVCPFAGVRLWKPLAEIDPKLRKLVVMLEDDKFYDHSGLDVDEIWNALEEDLERKKLVRGASTITQQLAKNLFLTKEKSFLRKATEVPIALGLERKLDKDEILELYLNTIEWGPGIYGAEAASRLYFDHPANTLSQEEAWLLALMIPNPKELNLWVEPRAKRSLTKRAKQLSTRLHLENKLSEDEAKRDLVRFLIFIDDWKAKSPHLGSDTSFRTYPVRWGYSKGFSLSEISSIRRRATGLLKTFRKQQILATYVDRNIQSKLEASNNYPSPGRFSNIIALMEGTQIRALITAPQKDQIPPEIFEIAALTHLVPKIFPARNIPENSLWR